VVLDGDGQEPPPSDGRKSIRYHAGGYVGTAVNALTAVASNDDENYRGGILTSKVTFAVTAGMTYQISVDGYGGAFSGNISPCPASASVSPRRDRARPVHSASRFMSVPGTGVTVSEAIDAVFFGHLRICQAPVRTLPHARSGCRLYSE